MIEEDDQSRHKHHERVCFTKEIAVSVHVSRIAKTNQGRARDR
jgi:hypothetical protein